MYKRQGQVELIDLFAAGEIAGGQGATDGKVGDAAMNDAVSYTHLTLPTKA